MVGCHCVSGGSCTTNHPHTPHHPTSDPEMARTWAGGSGGGHVGVAGSILVAAVPRPLLFWKDSTIPEFWKQASF